MNTIQLNQLIKELKNLNLNPDAFRKGGDKGIYLEFITKRNTKVIGKISSIFSSGYSSTSKIEGDITEYQNDEIGKVIDSLFHNISTYQSFYEIIKQLLEVPLDKIKNSQEIKITEEEIRKANSQIIELQNLLKEKEQYLRYLKNEISRKEYYHLLKELRDKNQNLEKNENDNTT